MSLGAGKFAIRAPFVPGHEASGVVQAVGEAQLTPVQEDVSPGEIACAGPLSVGLHAVRSARISKLSVERTTMAILPRLIPLLLALVPITCVPAVTLWLPQTMGLLK